VEDGVKPIVTARLFAEPEEGSRSDRDMNGAAARGEPSTQLALAGIDWSGLGGRVAATFVKPALWGSRNDLIINGFAGREAQQSYTDSSGGTLAIRHRFSETFIVQVGVDGQVGRSQDALGTIDYRLVGIPISTSYDSTDMY